MIVVRFNRSSKYTKQCYISVEKEKAKKIARNLKVHAGRKWKNQKWKRDRKGGQNNHLVYDLEIESPLLLKFLNKKNKLLPDSKSLLIFLKLSSTTTLKIVISFYSNFTLPFYWNTSLSFLNPPKHWKLFHTKSFTSWCICRGIALMMTPVHPHLPHVTQLWFSKKTEHHHHSRIRCGEWGMGVTFACANFLSDTTRRAGLSTGGGIGI